MGDLAEIIFVTLENDNQITCAASDLRTSTSLMQYKGGGAAQQRTLSVFRTEYVITANSLKPLLHVWKFNSQEQFNEVRLVVPGRVNALALSPEGCYLVAGIQETIYIWQLATGRMLNSICKHYQQINCIRFTKDGSHFVSAGKDGGVLVWNLTQVCARSDDNQTPLYSFNDHGLPVTDVHIGAGGMRAHMITVSLDRTCKIYDLSSGVLLLNVVFAEALQCVISNALETSVFVGTVEGNIYQFHTDSLPRTKECHIEKEHANNFVGHKTGLPVNCLSLAIDGQTMVSGGADQQVCIWNVPSRQLIKTIQQKGAVTNLALRFICASAFNIEREQPHMFGGNLRRMMDPPEVDEEDIIEVLITEKNAISLDEVLPPRDIPVNFEKTSLAPASVSDDVEKLRAEVQNLKRINRQMFEVTAKQVLQIKK